MFDDRIEIYAKDVTATDGACSAVRNSSISVLANPDVVSIDNKVA